MSSRILQMMKDEFYHEMRYQRQKQAMAHSHMSVD
jgi:hypothetical protein